MNGGYVLPGSIWQKAPYGFISLRLKFLPLDAHETDGARLGYQPIYEVNEGGFKGYGKIGFKRKKAMQAGNAGFILQAGGFLSA